MTTPVAGSSQNGPQRVYLQLEAAPWVWRLAAPDPQAAPVLTSHTGLPAKARGSYVDESGGCTSTRSSGLGVVHTLDMETAANAVEAGHWRPEDVAFEALPERFNYVLTPLPSGPPHA